MYIFSISVQTLTALAIIFAAWQLLFHSRQMHREFEHLYVSRYWVLMDQRSADFTISGRARKEDRPIVRGYLQLCEDEIDLRRLGRITDNTWEFWAGATLDQVAASAYTKELATLSNDEYHLLRELIRTEGADPLAKHWFWRKFHGL
jgi:hypothetical protein